MQELNVALLAVGGLTVILSLVSLNRSRWSVVSEPMAAFGLGVALGPLGVDLLHLTHWGEPLAVVEQFARLTVGVAVMAAALRLPQGYVRDHGRSLGWVLVPGMVGMWLVSGLVVVALADVTLWAALLVGAIVTPTDPVLAGTIVTGSVAEEYIPGPVRQLLTVESGANDGLAYPLVFLPILLIQHPPGQALVDWLLGSLLWEVGAAVAVGAAVGAAAGLAEKKSSEYDLLEETSLLSVTVALTFAVLGGVKLLGSDGILAAFVAGVAFNRFADADDELEEQRIQETVLRLFTFPVFVVFGAAVPWDQWLALGWTGVAIAVGVLVLRRLPMMAVFRWAATPTDGRDGVLFAGWFGPVGIAALFYATVAHRLVGHGTIWPVASLVVASSVVVHGATASPLTLLYGQSDE